MYSFLPPPIVCDHCKNSTVEFIHVESINWISLSEWPYIYFCRTCRAAVGCHANTNIPLGKMADSRIRKLRAHAHSIFDRVWKNGDFNRSELYQKLALALNIDVAHCHISQFTEDQLVKTIEWSKNFYFENIKVIQRRKIKKRNARFKQQTRTKSKIHIRKQG